MNLLLPTLAVSTAIGLEWKIPGWLERLAGLACIKTLLLGVSSFANSSAHPTARPSWLASCLAGQLASSVSSAFIHSFSQSVKKGCVRLPPWSKRCKKSDHTAHNCLQHCYLADGTAPTGHLVVLSKSPILVKGTLRSDLKGVNLNTPDGRFAERPKKCLYRTNHEGSFMDIEDGSRSQSKVSEDIQPCLRALRTPLDLPVIPIRERLARIFNRLVGWCRTLSTMLYEQK